MKFNDITDKQGICQEIDGLCDTSPTSYPVVDKTRRINNALQRVIGWIIGADGVWQFDDSNYTNLPIGTADLVAGQQGYTFAQEFLDMLTVKVKDINGHWQIIKPLDQKETGIALEELALVNGFPQYYDKNADGLKLIPAPSASVVTLTAGLKVEFQRTGVAFTAADDDEESGFASPYHVILAYMASVPYCMSYKKDRVAWLEKQIGDTVPPSGMKRDIIQFYSRRSKDERKIATMKPIRFR